MLKEKKIHKSRILADSAEPKSIDELRFLGIKRITAAKKGRGSISAGIDAVRRNRIIISPICKNFIAEIKGYVWETDRDGTVTNSPRGKNDHLMDAMRYAVSDALEKENFSFS